MRSYERRHSTSYEQSRIHRKYFANFSMQDTVHTHIHTYTHTYIHTYIHTHIHTYIHTHTHIHIPIASISSMNTTQGW